MVIALLYLIWLSPCFLLYYVVPYAEGLGWGSRLWGFGLRGHLQSRWGPELWQSFWGSSAWGLGSGGICSLVQGLGFGVDCAWYGSAVQQDAVM